MVRFTGAAEILAAVGLILHSLLSIQLKLTPITAIGLGFVMLFAISYHVSRGEAPLFRLNFVLIAIAAFIAWGRIKKVPIASKSSSPSVLA